MILRRALAVVALGFATVGGVHAQTGDENRDADALAADMRLLAANPNDVEALTVAGELTLKMGDLTAAAGFFGRAEKLDLGSARIKAGWGSLMVRSERPAEALRRFQDAERHGLPPARFAADRGLAYDLLGQQDRAQRDYRLVLRDHGDDEVARRYALSLAISGNEDEALRQLDPLLRRSDRAAWRARAFVLAMSGDVDGADRIATTMMAPGLGQALAPFFRRLPHLSPADRAFAVTFGELNATPERAADARTAPPLPPLAPDPYAPRPAAVAAPVPVVVAATDDGKRRKRSRRNDPTPAVSMPTPAPAPVAVALMPPAYVEPSVPAYTPPPVIARSSSRGLQLPIVTPPTRAALAVGTTPPQATSPVVASPARGALPVVTPPTRSTPPPAQASVGLPPPSAATAPVIVTAAAPPATPQPPAPGVADQPSPAEAGVLAPSSVASVSEDTVLARLATAPKPTPLPTPVRVIPRPAEPVAKVDPPRVARTKPKDEAVAEKSPPAAKPSRSTVKEVTADTARDAKAPVGKGKHADPAKIADADDRPALDKNGCPVPDAKSKIPAKGKAAARSSAKPSLSAKCKAIAAKAADKKDADKKGATTKSDPARVWVQVAGGANEASLIKAWDIMRGRAPDLLRGRQGWTTPWRASNRVLTGPFKSTDEAQDFVNKLGKSGVPAFVFSSDKGQKIEKLATGK